jgi:hypothetical protein
MADYDSVGAIVVTGARLARKEVMNAPVAVMAAEEQLGDLKLYRIPEPVTVSAKGLKQVAFLDRKRVEGEFVYLTSCDQYGWQADWGELEAYPTTLNLETVNDDEHQLGVALPSGGVTIFEPSSFGPQLIAEQTLRDYAEGQDVEIELAESSMVRATCALASEGDERKLESGKWAGMRVKLTNAGSRPATVRVALGYPTDWEFRTGRVKSRLKDGETVIELEVKPGETRLFDWKIRNADRK